jgi:hypothetical protein
MLPQYPMMAIGSKRYGAAYHLGEGPIGSGG